MIKRKYLTILKEKWILLLLILNAFVVFGQASVEPLFENGNAAYNEGDYKKAVSLYQQTLNTGQHSAALYFNLGNAYYRLNKVAESIYYYEKAKQLAPDDDDIQINSAFAQNMTIDSIEPLPKSQLAVIQNQLFSLWSLEAWSKVTLVLIWIFTLLFLGYLFLGTPRLKRSFFFLSLLSLVFFSGSLGITFSIDQQDKNTEYAILFSKKTDIWSEPNQRGEIEFNLHEGTKVQLLDVLDEWQKIRIANGSEGWVKNATLRSLNN